MRILIVDNNYGFTSDVESRLILEEIEDVDIVARNKIDHIHEDVEELQPDELLVSANLLNSHPSWDFGIPVKSYAKDNEGIALSAKHNIPCYGIITKAGDLLDAIAEGDMVEVTDAPVEEVVEEAPKPTPMPKQVKQPVKEKPVVNKPKQEPKYESRVQKAQKEQLKPEPVYEEDLAEEEIEEPVVKPTKSETKKNDIRSRIAEARAKEAEEERKRQEALRAQQTAEAEEELALRMGMAKPKAKVVTVYSAKGGVGKTSISSELATFLALTSHGRGHFKVCIADFNIDFGDVLSTLAYNPELSCMTLWAADIRDRLARGERPEDIQYNEAQVSVWLQHNTENGLYALLAPLTNEDSMDITEQEIEIMLDNLINNGGFDFVICDTGNNTRDSSFIPAEKADEIILVLTQSVNTANCNNSFLYTMKKIGFDMDKIKIVINKIKPAKTVGVAVSELEESIVNPETGQPFECIGHIKDNDSIRSANNLGEPLVYKSGHEFTKSIAGIAKHVIGDEFVLGVPEKKGFFSKLFKK